MSRSPFLVVLPALVLVLLTLGLYAPVRDFEFVNFDDDIYVTENPFVKSGLSANGVLWALGSYEYEANWHPLTWLSHMLDCELFGLDAGMHHIVSVIAHTLAALALFIALILMTRVIGVSFWVAALWAVHPLHVESVAWIAERKDVLSAVFWMLTLIAYTAYARRPALFRYALVVVCTVLGLLCKPMVVTLPFALLLLDFWPLGRFEGKAAGHSSRWRALRSLVIEKIPLLVLSVASSVWTLYVQRLAGAVSDLDAVPLGARIGNAVVSYVAYLWKAIRPADLAVFYPLPRSPHSAWLVAGCALFLIVVTVAVWIGRRRRGWLLVGWFWYLGTLVPVIGLVQVGGQAMADRYTYIPLIGIFLMVAETGRELACRSGKIKALVALAAVCTIGTAGLVTSRQLPYWHDSVTLFEHALSCTEDNYKAHNNLGILVGERGDLEAAERHFREVLRIKPEHSNAMNNLAMDLWRQGKKGEAVKVLRAATKKFPDFARAHHNLGIAYLGMRRPQQAVAEFREAIRSDPGYVNSYFMLGVTLRGVRRLPEAREALEQAVKLDGTRVEARNALGEVLLDLNDREAARAQFEAVLRLDPDHAAARRNLRR